MKSLLRTLFLLLVPAMMGTAWAQQLPQLTQYQFNDYVFNPAVAGSRALFEIRRGHRYQWVGIQDAPRTFTLSATTPVGRNMGIGGYIYTDHVGPTRRTGMQLSYTYHLKITDELKLGMALSGGMVQFLIDGSKIQLRDPGDPAMDEQLRGELLPDAKFAIYLHHPRFWFGATAPQLLRNNVQLMEGRRETLSRLEGHYYATAGYRFPLGEDFMFEPSVLVKYVSPVPPMIDATATFRYRKAFWLGASYRANDAWCAMVGCSIKETFQFGYSYDMLTSNLRNYSSGSHEVMLAIILAKPANRPEAITSP